MNAVALSRVQRLVRAAQRLSDARDPLGAEARRILPSSTGLSPEGVSLALEHCLETNPSESELLSLCSGVEPAPRALVSLSATVFTGVHRAIAIALAASSTVLVRPSRREPEMARLLRAAAEGLFECVDDLRIEAGDHLWAYGSDTTVEAVRSTLPNGVTLHEHASGLGVAVADVEGSADRRTALARALARDIVLFDQYGCLSPRVALARGSESSVLDFAECLGTALAEAERQVPIGTLGAEDRAAATRYRETMRFGGRVVTAGAGCIGVDLDSTLVLVPPPGRHLHLVRFTTLKPLLAPIRRLVTAAGIAGEESLEASVRELVPWARIGPFGSMQRPPFDGPVDRRPAHFAVSA